jgi:fumarate hydratase class II
VTLIRDACHGFVEYMVNGIELELAKIDYYVKNSLMLVTALNPRIGYDKAAKLAKTALEAGISLREACIQLGYLSGEEFDEIVRPENMTHP